MDTILNQRNQLRLERSCSASPKDWIRFAPPQAGLQRIEAFFKGHAYDPHRHDTYALGYTMNGVQSFDYRGSRADSITTSASQLIDRRQYSDLLPRATAAIPCVIIPRDQPNTTGQRA